MRFLGTNRIHHRKLLELSPTRESSIFLSILLFVCDLYSTAEYYQSKCCACLAVSVFLGNGIKPSQRHALTFEIESYTLAFMESKLAYSFGRIETLSKIFQHPVSENISGVSFDKLLSKSLILCAKQKVLFVYRQNVYIICFFI